MEIRNNLDRTIYQRKTINYIMKYITKVDEDHKGFKAVILTSAGIGKQYTENKHVS